MPMAVALKPLSALKKGFTGRTTLAIPMQSRPWPRFVAQADVPVKLSVRFGGHQRGGQRGGKYPRNKSPEKVPGRRRRAIDTDRYLVSGHTRLAHVIGTTWIQAMCGSQGLARRFHELVTANPHQVYTYDKQEIIDTLKARADSGGMVVINQDIYLRDPIGAQVCPILSFLPQPGAKRVSSGPTASGACACIQNSTMPPETLSPIGGLSPNWPAKWVFDGFDWSKLQRSCRRSLTLQPWWAQSVSHDQSRRP